ncbi:mitotic spindle checkpoint component MAD2 [Purpureocillium lavendulum]|uniref:Mitotic spindle checkpoint component MAD2 n=1 Tax=Purpureocillium lavendulum TaxID=1247861 RepID=A0AB34FVP4_9HYPO|nr:mitotic spindle checkpoint component MAD2 [Purpureocillium lavendulum]
MNWFAALYFNHYGQEELPGVRLLGLSLSVATMCALLVQVSRIDNTDPRGGASIEPAGIYIVLLLSTGTYMFLVPVYLLRLATCWNPRYSPCSWSKARKVHAFRLVEWALVVTAASTAVWFFTSHVPGLHRAARCGQYGFMFSAQPLDDNAGFLAGSAAVYILMLHVCVGKVLWQVCCGTRLSERARHERENLRLPQGVIDSLSRLQLLSDLTVFSVLVAAVELTIRWNGLEGVDDLDTAAQLVPLLVGAAVVLRAFNQLYRDEDRNEDGLPAASPCSVFLQAMRQTQPQTTSRAGPWREALARWTARYSGGRRDVKSIHRSFLHPPSPSQVNKTASPSTPPRLPALAHAIFRPHRTGPHRTPLAMSSKEAPAAKDKDKSKVHKLSLKGSSRLVAEFRAFPSLVNFGSASDRPSVKKYGLNMLVSADDQVKAYIKKIMSQLDKWMVGGKISKLVIVITDKDTGERVERWQFDVQISQPPPKSKSSKSASKPPAGADQENSSAAASASAPPPDNKTEAEIQAEIAAIFRQITASVTFLPQLSGDCTFNVLVYADADSDVPVEWGDSDAKEIANGEHVQLRGFSTANHRVDTLVSYRLGDS